MTELRQEPLKVVLRTGSALFRGKLQTPPRIRISGYLNGPATAVDLTEATMKSGSRSSPSRVANLTIPKHAVLYIFVSKEEEGNAAYVRYEREAMEGRLSDEPYFMLLGEGVQVSARVFGGTHALVKPGASFTSLDAATVHDKLLGSKPRKPQTMVINVKQVECCAPVGA